MESDDRGQKTISDFGMRIWNLKARIHDPGCRMQLREFRIQKMEVRVYFSYLLDSGYWLLTTGFEHCGFGTGGIGGLEN